jgi:Caspase domain
MERWAIVIGIDEYAVEEAKLEGAVGDALAMRKWLIEGGGGVPEDHVVLALGPRDPAPVQGLQTFPGTRSGVIDAVNEVVTRSGGKGERLFFYFAGHGISVRESYSDVSALVASDFSRARPDNSISLRSLWQFFETLEFSDQFLFVDACRNQPWPGEMRLGFWPTPGLRSLGSPPTQQFRLYATSPGLEAAELPGADGREGGAFTAALMQGLAGTRAAKVWNWRSKSYEVRWHRLVRYVRGEMEARKVKVAAGPVRQAFQIPQEESTRGVAGGEDDPVLVSFPAEHFHPEPLDVLLEPTDVAPVAGVIVRDDRGRIAAERRQLPGLPLHLELPPRQYAIEADAPPQYDVTYADEPVELYGPCEAKLNLMPSDAESPAATHASETGSLLVTCGDPLVTLEVAEAGGRIVVTGHGKLELPELAPGIYSARLRAPTGEVVERTVQVRPGEDVDVPLAAPPPPSPALADLARDTPITVAPDNTVKVADDLGGIASPRLSTILALAGAAAIQRNGAIGKDLRSLGQQAVKRIPDDAQAALYVLLGVDATEPARAAEELRKVRLRYWPVGMPAADATFALEPFSPAPGLGEYAATTGTGSHWVAIERAGHEPLVLALSLLPGRLAMLVLELSGPSTLRAYHYQPALTSDDSCDLEVLRRLEYLQRIEVGHELDAGYDIAAELLASEHTDPLAGCLGGYLLLRLGRSDELGSVVNFLLSRFPELPDGHVVAAEHAAAAGREDEARDAVARAIATGVPCMGEGITRLLDGLAEFRVAHDRSRLIAAVHQRYVQGSLWTAWTPERIVGGELLLP